ncbi:hypothetical protein AQZ52_02455 [Novosphingobium fuchskuhlense]|uniref:Uncharacterized protein n=1 Tax=Novosphingobium fuchskuhlense TaxID=1117702 RepID=A0A117UWM1_9SPHN|nr:hypothetical protein [Novosphingobium fuchskuhlense]KUR72173.1 hypothetical protein AQZ52_02455 [Novosphingobium fuchskuhlense]
MTINFPELARQAAADGAISAGEVLALRRTAWPDGRIDQTEAEAILAINDVVSSKSPEWVDFLVEAVGEYVLNGTEPRGYVSDATADWLIAKLDQDGQLDSVAELELLVRVLEKALGTPDRLKDYALAQIERAVRSGEGPTRDGGSLSPGSITEAECKLLRRVIFASGGDRPAAVSLAEAEMLFRLKDATLGAPNAPEWQRLFVQGVGSYLQGWTGGRAISRERAAELETFMNDRTSSLGRFFGRISRVSAGDLRSAAQDVLGGGPSARDFAGEADADATLTSPEQAWLEGHIQADGKTDPLEEALLAFLAEG